MNYEDIGAFTLDVSERITHRPSDIDNIYVVTERLKRSALEKRAFRNSVLPSVIGDHINQGFLQVHRYQFRVIAAKRCLCKAIKNAVVDHFRGTIEWRESNVHRLAQ